jgi:hypothetical protein
MTGRPRNPGGGDGGGSNGGRSRRGRGRAGSMREAEASVADVSRAGRANGAVTGPNPAIEPVTVTVTRKPFMPKTEFRRKMNALQQLGEEGELYKATNPVARDPSVSRDYRQDVIDRIYAQYNDRNPDFSDKLIDRVTRVMQPDHVWELQLGGPDDRGNLKFLHGPTNEDIGMRQIRPQIAKLEDGTPIRIEVIDE